MPQRPLFLYSLCADTHTSLWLHEQRRLYGQDNGKSWAGDGNNWQHHPTSGVSEAVRALDARGLEDDTDGSATTLLNIIEKEIDDETLRVDKEEPTAVGGGWRVEHEAGSARWSMTRMWRNGRERHTILVMLTQRDPSLDPECDLRGEHCPFILRIETTAMTTKGMSSSSSSLSAFTTAINNNNTHNTDDTTTTDTTTTTAHNTHHTTTTTNDERIHYRDDNNGHGSGDNNDDDGRRVLEFYMDVVEGECVVDKLHVTTVEEDAVLLPPIDTAEGALARADRYMGPDLNEAEEEVLDGLQAYLAERNIDDQLAEFIAQQSAWVEQQEYEQWLKDLKTFIAL